MEYTDPAPVLIVDDDDLVRSLLLRQLSRLNISADAAESAEEALAKIEVGHFSALVFDVSMQGRSGLDLAEFVRLFGSHLTGVPIFIFTGTRLSDEALELARRVNAEVFLKPTDLDPLLQRIISAADPLNDALGIRRPRAVEDRGDAMAGDYTEPES